MTATKTIPPVTPQEWLDAPTTLCSGERSVVLHKTYAHVGGGVAEGLVIGQLRFLMVRSEFPGWVYKTKEEWFEEVCLTPRQFDRVRESLTKRGLLEEFRDVKASRIYYRLVIPVLQSLCDKISDEWNEHRRKKDWTRKAFVPKSEHGSITLRGRVDGTELEDGPPNEMLCTTKLTHPTKRWVPPQQNVGWSEPPDLICFTENTTQRSTGCSATERKNKTEKTPSPDSVELPAWLPKQEWSDFVAMRKEIKKPIRSARQVTYAIRELERLRADGHPPDRVLSQSIANGWQGLFELRNGFKQSQPQQEVRRYDSLEEAMRKQDIRV